MNFKFFILFSIFICLTQGKTISVKTASDLINALKSVAPGDTISLADGTYSGKFEGRINGTSSQKITLTGSSNAILTSPTNDYGFYLLANYWVLKGIHLRKSAIYYFN